MPGFSEGEDLFPHNQMIEYPNVNHLEDRGQSTGEFQVLLTGLDAAEGVVMG